ncbi:hypothetical protein [Brevundimonas sp. SORGH_AS_0993]|uniref:hypothetical protein n=1 Tax=Brevundimonas sp. SORGH_AS_0993 TaxID=3041794 RepID=UPI00278A0926|nr:hypothetical protein [Brevundimonas sp. SORGH_AS_0993]MDQ1155422.1 hypothetical protein [Brevundimonas sp. SORGH_AS_0993]
MKWVLSILLALTAPIILLLTSAAVFNFFLIPMWIGSAIWTASLWGNNAPQGRNRALGNTLALLALMLELSVGAFMAYVIVGWSQM